MEIAIQRPKFSAYFLSWVDFVGNGGFCSFFWLFLESEPEQQHDIKSLKLNRLLSLKVAIQALGTP